MCKAGIKILKRFKREILNHLETPIKEASIIVNNLFIRFCFSRHL